MTELAYLAGSDAAYERTFRARVTALPPGGVVLDRTFFYPEGGGQPADHGSLELADGRRRAVVDVLRSGSHVVHRLDRDRAAPALHVGDAVTGTIDWDRRYRHMRLHTLQHLLSARLFERTGRRTHHARFSGDSGTIDLDGPWPPTESLDALAHDVEERIREARSVRIAFVPRAQWDRAPSPRSGLVPLAPQVDPVRVIEIEGMDVCPCGGTHVRSTAELGGIQLHATVPLPGPASRLPFTRTGDAPPTPSA